MGRDDSIRRGSSPRKLKHPYAAIEHRVIDSPAFQSLTGNAAKLLMLMVRQLNASGNNGRLKTSAAVIPRSVMAEHTVSRATNELIAHGLINRTCGREYDTKSGRGMAALYAATWLPLTKQTEGLHLAGFVRDAWKTWNSEIKKPPAELQCYHGKNGIYAPESTASSAVVPPPKIAKQNLLVPVERVGEATTPATNAQPGAWIPSYLTRLVAHGLAGRQCFAIHDSHALH